MKKCLYKRMMSKALAAVTGAAVFASVYMPALAGAADTPEYISEVYLSYGSDENSAKQWLIDNGYTVLDQDLNEDADGAFSDKRSVYLGYRTTTDKEQAITDMRAMNMNGDYSYEAYEKLLENRRSEINDFIRSLITALGEYRENYKAGKTKALIAHDNMNLYLDDDSNYAPLGDLLLKPIKEEMTEAEYAAAPTEHADMTTMMMQGNLTLVREIMTFIAYAADTSDTSWLERVGKAPSFDDLYTRFENEYGAVSESEVYSLMAYYYDEEAKKFADCIEELKTASDYLEEVGLPLDASEDDISSYFEEHTDKSEEYWASSAIIAGAVKDIKIDGTDFLDYVTFEDLDFGSIDDRMALYPIIDVLSPGQIGMMAYTDFKDMIVSGSLDEEGWQKTYESVKEDLKDKTAYSVYSGVIRSAFEPGGVALTNEARNMQSATGQSFDDGLFGVGIEAKNLITLGTGLFLTAGGFIAQRIGSGAVRTTMKFNDALKYYQSEAKRLNDLIIVKADQAREAILPTLSDYKLMEKFQTSFEEVLASKNDGSTLSDLGLDVVSEIRDYYYDDPEYLRMLDQYSSNSNKLWDLQYSIEYPTAKPMAYVSGDSTDDMLVSGCFKRPGLELLGTVVCVAGIALSIYSAVCIVQDIYEYYHQDMKPIPRILVNESSDEKGRSTYTYYACTLCNRTEQGFENKDLEDYGDMNGDVGKQWLALYTTKDKAAGEPITVDIIAQKGSNKFPADKGTTIRLFGKTDSLNIVSEEFCYNDEFDGLYIFSGTESKNNASREDTKAPADTSDTGTGTSSVTETASGTEAADSSEGEATAVGSVVGTGTMVVSCVGSAALGALIAFFIVRRKNGDKTAA